jgi:heme O synthase-like polyprenyltransferase
MSSNTMTIPALQPQEKPWVDLLAAGRLRPVAVLWFGTALSVLGSVYLVAAVNLLASLLALGTLLPYSFFYTPLKRKSPL